MVSILVVVTSEDICRRSHAWAARDTMVVIIGLKNDGMQSRRLRLVRDWNEDCPFSQVVTCRGGGAWL